MSAPAVVPAKPAASVILVRDAEPGASEPIEVYMIRRQKSMRFLGGFYAFPGGKVDPADSSPEIFARCRGLAEAEAAACFADHEELAPLAFWVTGVRELLEECGVLLACDEAGRPVDPCDPATGDRIDAARKALVAGRSAFGEILTGEGWHCDLHPLRYLSHFVTPRSSPIRFAARFFLCRLPAGQTPRLFTEEASEAFWIHPAEAYGRFVSGDMAMAEPAEYALGFLAQFASVDDLWAACMDGREKFAGLIHRIEFWGEFDWKAARWPDGRVRPLSAGGTRG